MISVVEQQNVVVVVNATNTLPNDNQRQANDLNQNINGVRIFVAISSIVVLAFGITEIVIGVNIFTFLSNSNFGAWWAGTAACASALFGFLSVWSTNT